MSAEGNGMSDERIGEALIKEVIEEQLREVPSEDVPPLTPLAMQVESEQEQKLVTQVGKLVRIVGDRLQGDQEIQDAIDGMVTCPGPGSILERFKAVAHQVFIDGITWERIAVFIYMAGKAAVKVVVAHLPQLVRDVLRWTVDFFKNHLLRWVQDHGGWINSFSELASVSMSRVSSLSSHSYGLIIIFIAGMVLGSVITWRMGPRP